MRSDDLQGRGVQDCGDAADLMQGLADKEGLPWWEGFPSVWTYCGTVCGAAHALAGRSAESRAVASGSVAAAVDGKDGDRQRSLALLHTLIELARH